MKRIAFLFCIFFGISLSACPLAPKSDTPTPPKKPDALETAEDKWIKLVASKSTFDPCVPSHKDIVVFDQRGNAKWTSSGKTYNYNLFQVVNNGKSAIYRIESGKIFAGFSVNSDSELEIYSMLSLSPEDIDWSSTPSVWGILR